MKIIFQLLLITFLVSSLQSFAQKKWNVTRATDLQTGDVFVCSGVFEISEDQIQFIQKNGSIRYDFRITGVAEHDNGSSLEYQINFRGLKGIIRLSNQPQESLLIIEINRGADRILPYQFSIQSLS